MQILSVKKICLCYIHYETIEIIFEKKYCNFPFLVICRFPFFIFLASSWYQKAKIGLQIGLQNKKRLIFILKDFIKQPVIKQSPTFLRFFFHIDYCISLFFLSLSKRLQILRYWYDFIDKLSLYINMEKTWKYW